MPRLAKFGKVKVGTPRFHDVGREGVVDVDLPFWRYKSTPNMLDGGDDDRGGGRDQRNSRLTFTWYEHPKRAPNNGLYKLPRKKRQRQESRLALQTAIIVATIPQESTRYVEVLYTERQKILLNFQGETPATPSMKNYY